MDRMERVADTNLKFDALLLFAEERGVFLTDRQLDYCRRLLHCNDSFKAARDAGFPDPEEESCKLYDAYSDILEEWREEKKMDYLNSLNVYRSAQKAEIIREKKLADGSYEEVRAPNHATRIQGTKGLCDMLGFNAPKEIKGDQTFSVRWLALGEEPEGS